MIQMYSNKLSRKCHRADWLPLGGSALGGSISGGPALAVWLPPIAPLVPPCFLEARSCPVALAACRNFCCCVAKVFCLISKLARFPLFVVARVRPMRPQLPIWEP